MEIGAAGTPLCHDRLCESKPAAGGQGGRPTPASPAGPENSDRWRVSGTYGPLSSGKRRFRSPARQAPEPAGRRLCTDPRNRDRWPPGVWLFRPAGWPQYLNLLPGSGFSRCDQMSFRRAPVRQAHCCRVRVTGEHLRFPPLGIADDVARAVATSRRPNAGSCKPERSSPPRFVHQRPDGHCTRQGPCKGAREPLAVEAGHHEVFSQRDAPGALRQKTCRPVPVVGLHYRKHRGHGGDYRVAAVPKHRHCRRRLGRTRGDSGDAEPPSGDRQER